MYEVAGMECHAQRFGVGLSLHQQYRIIAPTIQKIRSSSISLLGKKVDKNKYAHSEAHHYERIMWSRTYFQRHYEDEVSLPIIYLMKIGVGEPPKGECFIFPIENHMIAI